jgi:hypothetical protein
MGFRREIGGNEKKRTQITQIWMRDVQLTTELESESTKGNKQHVIANAAEQCRNKNCVFANTLDCFVAALLAMTKSLLPVVLSSGSGQTPPLHLRLPRSSFRTYSQGQKIFFPYIRAFCQGRANLAPTFAFPLSCFLPLSPLITSVMQIV